MKQRTPEQRLKKTRRRRATRKREFIRLCEKQKWLCHYCGVRMLSLSEAGDEKHPRLATKDHIVPRCRGGNDTSTNKVASCYSCNQDKADKSYEEFQCLQDLKTGFGTVTLGDTLSPTLKESLLQLKPTEMKMAA